MKRFIKEYIRYLYLHAVSADRLLNSRLVQTSQIADNIVVSLTTIPARIDHLKPTLNALIDQSVRPKIIYLTIPEHSHRENKPYTIPNYLKNHPVVSIIKSQKDWGPASKLLPIIQQEQHNPDLAIIAVDDDNIYPRDFVFTFQKGMQTFPDCALSLRGLRFSNSLKWQEQKVIKGTSLKDPFAVDIMTGCAGILVRPRFFDSDIFQYESAPARAFFVDDIWFSGHLAKRGIGKRILPFAGRHVYMPSLPTLYLNGLDKNENRDGDNDNSIIQYFKPHWGAGID